MPTPLNNRAWGRVEHFDPASRAYALPGAITSQQPRTKRWVAPLPAPLDQLRTPQCVAFSWAHLAIAEPVPTTGVTAVFAELFYRSCKKIDGLEPGSEGTTVLAGAKWAKRIGLITEYRWAMSEPDLAAAISQVGPAVIGVQWRQGMLAPAEPSGLLSVSGPVVGGHAVLVIGVNVEQSFYWILNPWGPGWGQHGYAKIRRADMARLIGGRRGEACIPIQAVAATAVQTLDPNPTRRQPVPVPPAKFVEPPALPDVDEDEPDDDVAGELEDRPAERGEAPAGTSGRRKRGGRGRGRGNA
jgi:hypothetical protein